MDTVINITNNAVQTVADGTFKEKFGQGVKNVANIYKEEGVKGVIQGFKDRFEEERNK